jgi:hypothetical protein
VWKEAGWDAAVGVPVGIITLEDVLEELMQVGGIVRCTCAGVGVGGGWREAECDAAVGMPVRIITLEDVIFGGTDAGGWADA